MIGFKYSRFTSLAAGIVVSSMLFAAPATRPTGDAVIDNFIKVTGGVDAYGKVTSRVATGKISIPSQNLNGDMAIYTKAPSFSYMQLNLPGVGTIERGYDGKIAWEKNPLTGTRVLEGEEKSQLAREATIDSELNWRKDYRSAAMAGTEKINGNDCYKIELTTQSGSKETRDYDIATGLLVQTEMLAKTGQGDFPIVAAIGDWRDVNGVKMPFQSTQDLKSMNFQQVITIDKIETNVAIPDSKFAIPQDVEDLLKHAASAPASQPAQ